MADVNLASLDFNVIIHDEQFNDKIKELQDEADALNESLSKILDIHGSGVITKEEHQSAMRRLREEFQEAQNQQRLKLQWSKETAKMATDEALSAQKVSQAVEKTNQDRQKGLILEQQLATATKKKEEAEINATAATERKSKAEKDAARAEIQRQTAATNLAAAEERKLTATNRRIASQRQLNAELERENRVSLSNSRIWRDIKNLSLAYFSVTGAWRLTKHLVDISAEFEKQRVSLHAILQDANGAEKIFAQIKELAVKSPFQFKDLVTYTKQLSAFSIPMEELYDTTKMLADVSAGLGVGMDRLVLAYGQIRSASFLRGQEVRQLTEAGIPILEELRKQFEEMGEAGITAGEVFDKISSRQVTFEMVEKVFKDMTSEGGKFYQMQEVLAETLSGKISNLTDAYQIMFSEIGEKTNGILVGTVDTLRSIADNYEKIGKSVMELVAAYGVYRGTMIALEALNGAFALSNHKVLESVVKLAKQMKTAVLSNPYALLAAGATAAAYAVYKLTAAIVEDLKTQKQGHKIIRDFTKGMDEMNMKATSEVATLDKLYVRLKTAKEGTEEYDAARKSILSQYDTYIQKMKDEGKEVSDLISLYGSLKKAVQEAAYDKYRDMLTADAKEAFDNAEEDIMKAFNSKFSAWTAPNSVRQASAAQKEALWMYVTGVRSASDLIDANVVSRPMLAFFEYLRKEYSTVSNAYTYAVTEVDNAHKHLTDTFADDAKNMTDWQRKVNDALSPYSKEIQGQLKVDAATNWSEYVDTIQKKYKDLNLELAKNAGVSETAAAANRKEIEAINTLNTALGGRLLMEYNINKQTKDNSNTNVDNVEQQIKIYQKLKDAYADLVEYISDSDARSFLATMFPNDMVYSDYDEEIRRLTASLYNMGEAGIKAALGLESAMNDDKIKEYLKHLKEVREATDRANEVMAKVEDISGLFGEGAEFDISKSLKKYKDRLKKIKEERQEALDAIYDEASKTGIFGLGYLEKGEKIDKWVMQEEADALTQLNEEVRRQAEAWVRSWDGIASIDISHMADLTTNELNKLMEALQKLSDNPEQYFSDDLKLGFEDTENSLKVFIAAIQEYVSQLNSQAEEKKWDKIVKKIRLYYEALKISTKALKELADTAGWSGISDMADHIDRAASAATTFVKNLAEGDVVGATMTAISYAVEEMVHLATAAMEYRNTLREIELEMTALRHASELSAGVNSIFGTDTYRALKNAYNLVGQLQGKMDGMMTTLSKITAHVDKSKWWQYILAPTGVYAWYQHFFGSEKYSTLLSQIGGELFDETGRVNVETLELMQEKFDKLSKSEQQALAQAIQDAKDYNAALDQIDETMSDLVGQVADNFADAIIDQWKAAGDAAADYSEILSDLATQYAKMYIRSSILENIFDPDFEEQLKKMTLAMDATGVMSLFDEKVKQLEDYYPFFEQVLNGLSDYFDTSETESKNTLGGGIKSITEDTANLLASYVNAIRADVAAIRQAVVAENTQALPSPTLAEYLTQIQANTYNNAVAAQAILANLQSMMTVSDGPALRVFM